jgi:hypothetical protein
MNGQIIRLIRELFRHPAIDEAEARRRDKELLERDQDRDRHLRNDYDDPLWGFRGPPYW